MDELYPSMRDLPDKQGEDDEQPERRDGSNQNTIPQISTRIDQGKGKEGKAFDGPENNIIFLRKEL